MDSKLQELMDAAARFLSIALMVTGDKRGMSMTLFKDVDGKPRFRAASVEFQEHAEALAKPQDQVAGQPRPEAQEQEDQAMIDLRPMVWSFAITYATSLVVAWVWAPWWAALLLSIPAIVYAASFIADLRDYK